VVSSSLAETWHAIGFILSDNETLSLTSLDDVIGTGGYYYGPVVGTVTAFETLNGVPDSGSTLLLLGLAGVAMTCLRSRMTRLA
jgi:hypothetical protein